MPRKRSRVPWRGLRDGPPPRERVRVSRRRIPRRPAPSAFRRAAAGMGGPGARREPLLRGHSLGVFQHGLAALGLATAPPPLGHRRGRGGEGVTATAADATSVFELWVSRRCFFLFMLSLLFLGSHLSVVELGDVLCLLVPFAFALT